MTIRDGFIFLFFAFTVTGYVLLALVILARAFSNIVSNLRDTVESAEEPALVSLPEQGEIAVFESKVEEAISGVNVHLWSPASIRHHPGNSQA